jgi:hypothetical protein
MVDGNPLATWTLGIWGDRIGTMFGEILIVRDYVSEMLEVPGLLSYPNLRIISWSDGP